MISVPLSTFTRSLQEVSTYENVKFSETDLRMLREFLREPE